MAYTVNSHTHTHFFSPECVARIEAIVDVLKACDCYVPASSLSTKTSANSMLLNHSKPIWNIFFIYGSCEQIHERFEQNMA